MELKYIYGNFIEEKDASSNRTFMELKLLTNGVETYFNTVLIVPLWN